MAINVASVVQDPDLKTPGGFIIRRYTVTVSAEGRPVSSYVDIEAEGIVVPSGALGMTRTPESELQGDNITIYSTTPISTGDASINQPADDIIWHDQMWQVKGQDDYLAYGYNVAVAQLIDPGGRPVG